MRLCDVVYTAAESSSCSPVTSRLSPRVWCKLSFMSVCVSVCLRLIYKVSVKFSLSKKWHNLMCEVRRLMSFCLCYACDTRSRSLCKKLKWKIWRKFITVSCTKTTLRPIAFHGSCHVSVSVLEYSCVLLRARNWYQKKLVPDWPTHVQGSWACVAGIIVSLSTSYRMFWLWR